MSSQGEAWVNNLFINAYPLWVNQTYGSRPPVERGRWYNNVFTGGGLDRAPQESTFRLDHNLFLAGAKKSHADEHSRVVAKDPGFQAENRRKRHEIAI